MKPFEKFLNDTLSLKELLDIYLELRMHFQELGFTEEELSSPPEYTPKMMTLFHKFTDTQKYLFNQVNSYGFDVDWTDFTNYIKLFMTKIDELTPLNKHGNNKRRDKWDED